MELKVTSHPPTWATHGTSYETRFIYTGFGRIDVQAKLYQTFQSEPFSMFERPFAGGVISRSYAVELATVTEYSKTPRRWKEETPNGTQYFEELRRIPC
jgi:hypothetical protein